MFKIFNGGVRGKNVRFRRKENVYMIWEYLFGRKVVIENKCNALECNSYSESCINNTQLQKQLKVIHCRQRWMDGQLCVVATQCRQYGGDSSELHQVDEQRVQLQRMKRCRLKSKPLSENFVK